jgi:hypothetical protein
MSVCVRLWVRALPNARRVRYTPYMYTVCIHAACITVRCPTRAVCDTRDALCNWGPETTGVGRQLLPQ